MSDLTKQEQIKFNGETDMVCVFKCYYHYACYHMDTEIISLYTWDDTTDFIDTEKYYVCFRFGEPIFIFDKVNKKKFISKDVDLGGNRYDADLHQYFTEQISPYRKYRQ